jgi:uncharacterized protein YjbI with pentapeptide repeats
MANWEHVSILKQGADAWNEWIDRQLESDINFTPNLAGADLREATLGGADLANADLSEANLSSADLKDADLSSAGILRADLSDADLNGADLNRANLTSANLERADLSVADLAGAQLQHASIKDANLGNADLRGATFLGADLAGADLSRADLRGASLAGANLKSADLIGTNLNNTSLDAADLSGAALGGTIIANTDLSAAKGLDSIEHLRPSTIGIDTLFRSGGRIPEAFLRGCGVPDDLISYARSLIGRSTGIYSCFICYSRQDQAFARRLHDRLQASGIRCWLDEKESASVDDDYEQADREINPRDIVLLCCSKSSLTSSWVDHEISRALDRGTDRERALMNESQESALALIPLNLDGYLFEWKSARAAQLKQQLTADFTDWDRDNARFEREFQQLLNALRTGGAAGPATKL